MAVQPELELLPEWWARLGASDSGGAFAAGPNIVGLIVAIIRERMRASF